MDSPSIETLGRRVVNFLMVDGLGNIFKTETRSDLYHRDSLKLFYSVFRIWSSIHENALAFHIVSLINNIYLSENLLNFRDMVQDLVGSGEAFIVLMWLSEICLLLSQHLILTCWDFWCLIVQGEASERPMPIFWGQITIGLSAFHE